MESSSIAEEAVNERRKDGVTTHSVSTICLYATSFQIYENDYYTHYIPVAYIEYQFTAVSGGNRVS
jgi:hypothetical protein